MNKKLDFKTRVALGGLGALTPTLLSFLTVDMQVLFTGLTLFLAMGYVLRAGILFTLGGTVGFLYKDETSPLKLFQLGIATPALLTIFISAQSPTTPPKEISLNPTFATEVCASTTTIHRSSTGLIIPNEVYYSTTTLLISTSPIVDLKEEESPIQQMFRGFFAKRYYRHYAVRQSTGAER